MFLEIPTHVNVFLKGRKSKHKKDTVISTREMCKQLTLQMQISLNFGFDRVGDTYFINV